MVAAIGAAVGIGGALISSSAAGDAADAQSQASQQANMMQAMQAQQMREDLAPWTDSGVAAQDRLSQLMGIGGVGGSGLTSMGLQTGLTPDQVRQQLLSRYTSTSTSDPSTGIGRWSDGQDSEWGRNADGENFRLRWAPGQGPPKNYDSSIQESVDEEALNAAIQQYYAEQKALNDQYASDPAYGSLMRPYRDGEEFSFTGKDLANEPGYQFGLQQGTQGIERGQAARGNFLSGAAMKELNRFNQDYAGTKFNEGFNRSQSTWNTNLGAYDSNRDRVYNFLTGVSTLGQNSAARVGTNNQQTANNMSNNLLAAGNAQAAGAVAQGNAWQSGLNTAANAFNTSNNNINSPSGWNLMLANQSSDPIGSLNTQLGWTG